MEKKQEDIHLGKKIKAIRSNLNQDQKTFADSIGATVSALSNWENGRNKPNDIMLQKIAKIGNISVTELVAPPLEILIPQYLDEIMMFEIKQGEEKYKLFYNPTEKQKFLDYLFTQNYKGLSSEYGVRYLVKNRLERYLKEYYEYEKFTPFSNENAIEYTNEKVVQLINGLNKYFKKDGESTGFARNYLFDEQIKEGLSPELYNKILHAIYDLDSSLNKIREDKN